MRKRDSKGRFVKKTRSTKTGKKHTTHRKKATRKAGVKGRPAAIILVG